MSVSPTPQEAFTEHEIAANEATKKNEKQIINARKPGRMQKKTQNQLIFLCNRPPFKRKINKKKNTVTSSKRHFYNLFNRDFGGLAAKLNQNHDRLQ